MLSNKISINTSTKAIIFTILTIFLLFLIGAFFRWQNWKDLENHTASSSIPVVSIMIARPETQNTLLSLPGYLVADHVSPILARTNGYLKNFLVDIGDTVQQGQLLAEIDTPDIDAEWIQAKADLDSAMAKKDIAEITARRWSDLYAEDAESISKQEVDQTKAEYETAIAEVNAAKARVDHLEVLKNFKYILAPFEGIIVERNIDIGSLVSSGNETMTQPYLVGFETTSQPLFKISNMETLRVFVEVPQSYHPYIKRGIEATVTIPEYPNKTFKGIIERTAMALDQSSRTMLTQINIENTDKLLRPGLYSTVDFTFPPYRDTFTIPISALIIRNGPPCVAKLLNDNTVALQQVEIGRDHGKSVQIIKGIHTEDRLILNPNYKIKEGIKVKTRVAKDMRTYGEKKELF